MQVVKHPKLFNSTHLDQALRNLQQFDVILFLNNFQAGLKRLGQLHPEWLHAEAMVTNAHKDHGTVKPPSLEEELVQPGVNDLVNAVTHLDQQLYRWALRHFHA